MYTAQTKNRENSRLSFEGTKSLTEQTHLKDVKIQNVLRKAKKQGIVTHVAKYAGTYSDMIDAPSFHEAQNAIASATSMFETVPAEIRKHFDNDPSKYLEFMQNPENYDAIEELGFDNSHLPEPERAPPAAPAATDDSASSSSEE